MIVMFVSMKFVKFVLGKAVRKVLCDPEIKSRD